MQLIRQELTCQCVMVSAAMVLDCHPKDMIDYLGHDGSEIVAPEQPEPYNMRGFHIQEIIDFSLSVCNTAVTEIEVQPVILTASDTIVPVSFKDEDRFLNRLAAAHKGILMLRTETGGGHAVAFHNPDKDVETTMVYDPSRGAYKFTSIRDPGSKIIAVEGFLRFDEIPL